MPLELLLFSFFFFLLKHQVPFSALLQAKHGITIAVTLPGS